MNITDSLINMVSGLGTARDKRTHTEFTHIDLDRGYLGTLYHNWLFGKVVDIPAEDMTKKWRVFDTPSLDSEQLEAVKNAEKNLKIKKAFTSALKWARLYGGSAIILNMDERLGNIDTELDVEQITIGDLKSLLVVDRWDLSPHTINTTNLLKKFRMPELYQLSNQGTIHSSRIIRFEGYELPWLEYQQNQFWGGSVCNRVYDEVLNAKITTQSISSMIFEANIDVITVKNLFERIMNKKSLDSLIKRFQLANVTKSINKALIIDQDDETYKKVPTSFAGLPGMITEFLSVVAAAADIPATRMLGQSAKGFSATGEGDLKNYYDMITAKQESDLYDPLGQLDQILVRSVLGEYPDDWGFKFPPLWQATAKELAEIEKLHMESDTGNINNGSILPYHAAARLLSDGIYPTLDNDFVDDLEGMAELDAQEAKNFSNEKI